MDCQVSIHVDVGSTVFIFSHSIFPSWLQNSDFEILGERGFSPHRVRNIGRTFGTVMFSVVMDVVHNGSKSAQNYAGHHFGLWLC